MMRPKIDQLISAGDNNIELIPPEEEEDDEDLDEINRMLDADDIEPEPVNAGTKTDDKEDELDEIIRLGGGEETYGFEVGEDWFDGNKIGNEEAGKVEMLLRFGLVRRPKERFSDESSDEEEVEKDGGGQKLATIDEQEMDAESLATTNREDRKSRFTNYSMSSAVIKRAEGLRQIDDHFEALYSSQYAEELEGEGPDEEGGEPEEKETSLIDPNNSERFQAMLGEEEEAMRRRFPRELPDDELKRAVLRYAQAKEDREKEGNDQEETERIRMPADGAKRGRWDCESIVSMYSNIYNHPTEIREHCPTEEGIGANRKRNNIGLTKSGSNPLEKMDTDELASVRSSRVSTASTFRPKGETPEERRQRKQAVKEERRERRMEKKANRVAFNEVKRQMIGNSKKINERQIF